MNYGFMGGQGFGMGLLALGPLILLLMVWTLFWKGLALWHASKHDQNWWFLILLVVNTAGILEIIYLFAVLKMKAGDLFSKNTSTTIQM
jgi:hypothetical protein